MNVNNLTALVIQIIFIVRHSSRGILCRSGIGLARLVRGGEIRLRCALGDGLRRAPLGSTPSVSVVLWAFLCLSFPVCRVSFMLSVVHLLSLVWPVLFLPCFCPLSVLSCLCLFLCLSVPVSVSVLVCVCLYVWPCLCLLVCSCEDFFKLNLFI